MPIPDSALRRLRSPWAAPLLLALLTIAVRVPVVLQGLAANPQVMRPTLDARVFLTWAGEIAAGDVLGRAGVGAGEPWFFNPLPAYLLAPFVAGFDAANGLVTAAVEPLLLRILLAQVLLGAGTTVLTTLAARRLFGVRAGWIAGAGVALSQVLAQLSAHVSAAELAAFLVAGACFATTRCDESAEAGRAAPLLAGLWLGVGALARPITPLALPLVGVLFWLRGGRKLLAPILVLVAFTACALPSLARNWSVSGEAHVYTASSGANMWLGNSPVARASRSMLADDFRFDPRNMHDEARATMMRELQTDETPQWGAVSSFYRDRTLGELSAHPAEFVGFMIQKARWFWSPREVPSSAALAVDRRFAPALWAAFVPTWLLASLGFAGLALFWRRPDVLLGPGALVLAHWAVVTLVFPLSHYRAPAIPALAILAAGLIDVGCTAWRAGDRGRVWGGAVLVLVLAVAGAVPSQPDDLLANAELNVAHAYLDLHDEALDAQEAAPSVEARAALAEVARQRLDQALTATARAEETFARTSPGRSWAAAPAFRAELLSYRGDLRGACDAMEEALAISGGMWFDRVKYSCWLEALGDPRGALEQAELAYEQSGGLPEAAMRVAEAASLVHGRAAAERFFSEARAAGLTPVVGRCGGR